MESNVLRRRTIIPAGTQQGWARWKSSAHDEIEPIRRFAFGSLTQSATVISAGIGLFRDLGWPDLLKSLIRAKGDLVEALLIMREDLIQETEASANDNPDSVVIEKVSRLESALRELEEEAKLQESDQVKLPTPPKGVSLSNRNHPFYSPATKASFPVQSSSPLQSIAPSTEQAFLEKIMEASANKL